MPESQLRKGVLELVVLASLEQRPTYGGALLDTMTQSLGSDLSSGTLYPLLARLRKTGMLTTHWEESPVGPPRKVYRVTERGSEKLRTLHAEWNTLVESVSTALKGTQS
jgi:PadR family transcriptional regulator PadR